MSINSKKIVSIALTASTVLWAMGVASLPLANAQTTSDLQAQIAALLSQIQQLQGQLGTSTSGGSMSSCYNFTSDLTVGSTGAAVTALQQALISGGYLTGVSAPTGYFGALTKAAVSKWQMAKGITPTAGYFGAKSRAVYASSCVSTGTGSGTGTTTGTGTGTGTTAPATGLSVGLASDNPSTGSLISSGGSGSSCSAVGAARVPVLGVNFTAGNSGAVTISDVKFHKQGVLSDNSISGAYLTLNNKVIAQYTSISNGVIDFSGLSWQIPAGQTEDVQLAIDTSGNLSAGNTTGFTLSAATDVTAWDASNNAVTPMGSFPANGNIFTVTNVSSPCLSSVTASSSFNSAGNQQVTAGTQGNLIAGWTFNVTSNKVWLKSINVHIVGSANPGDIRNVKLVVNGTQIGQTLATVGQDGTAYFDASAAPAVLNAGNNNVQVFADVMGSPNRSFTPEILNGYDVLAVDSQYNVPVTVGITSNPGAIAIQQGQITVTQDASTPTGNIAKGQSQTTLAKFDIYAAGEAVRVKFLDFYLNFTGLSTTTNNLANQIKNVTLTDDAGTQVGSTINTPPSGNNCTNAGGAAATVMAASGGASGNVYADCFGTSGSPINYTVPANTTRVLSLKVDVQPTATFSTVTADLTGDSSNLQGLISSANANTSGPIGGSALSLSNSSMSVGQNSALGSQTVSAGVTNQKIGSYAFTASSAEGVNINNLTVQVNGSTNVFQNLKVLVNGAQFGQTQGVVNAGTQYSFSGTPFSIPAGGTVNVDVYADTLSNASGLISPATTLTGVSAVGQVSFSSIGLPSGNVNGQNLTFSSTGATIQVTADSSQVPTGQVVMGSTGNPLATFRLTETSNIENVKVTDLKVIDMVGATSTIKPGFSNLTLWSGSTNLGSAGTAVADASGTGYIYSFHFGTPVVIPQANSISLTLKGDAASYASSGATDNSTSSFQIATSSDNGVNSSIVNTNTTSTVVALGATSNKPAGVTITSASGNQQTVLRSSLIFAATPLGATSGRGKISSDQLATLSFSANSAGPIAVNTVTITFSGTAPSGTAAFLDGVTLRDENNNSLGTGNTTSTVCTNGGSCTKTFTLGSGAGAGQVISAGTTRNWTLVVDSTKTTAVTGTSNVNLVATINANTDIRYTDGLDSSAVSGLSIPSSILTPINLNSVVYQQGT